MTRAEILAIAKPILFNTDMVRAILEERKSETRRVVKPKYRYDEYGFQVVTNMGTWERYVEKTDEDQNGFDPPRYINPPYQVGDYLYVRETWSEWTDGYVYKAWTSIFPQPGRYADEVMTWRPSIHMPKEAARIFLRVTDVRVERLRYINNKDAKHEGVTVETDNSGRMHRFAFSKLWDSTIPKKDLSKYGWNVNPWVWVIRFERVKV